MASTDSMDAQQLTHRLVTLIQANAGVAELFSYDNTHDPLLIGAEGRGAIILVRPSATATAADRTLAQLRTRTDQLSSELHRYIPGLTLEWTGAAALNADLRRVSAAEAQAAEARVMPIVLLVLLLVFRSLSAALLTVSRFREALASGQTSAAAARLTRRTAGRTIMLSAAGIAVGLAALLIIPVNEIRSIAIGGLIVLCVAALLANTLLPAVLRLLGARINTWTVPLPKRQSRPGQVWEGLASLLFRRPVLFLLGGLTPLLLLAYEALDLNIGLPRGDWLPHSSPSVRAIGHLDAMGRPDLAQVIQVLVTMPAGVHADDPQGRALMANLAEQLRYDPRTRAAAQCAI